jgi:hypothetical protein
MKQEIEIQVIGYQYDTTSEENTLMLIDDILNLWGRLDIWVAVSLFISLFPFHKLILERGSSRPNHPQRNNAIKSPALFQRECLRTLLGSKIRPRSNVQNMQQGNLSQRYA